MHPGGKICSDRYQKMIKARDFFMALYTYKAEFICIENPISLKICNLPQHSQTVQPWQHGHPYSKATRFWLKNLPLLQPTNVLNKYSPWCPSNTGSKTGSKHAGFASSSTRSHTFPGIAEAMAGQWGDIKSKNKG
jgi:hypothetical protein